MRGRWLTSPQSSDIRRRNPTSSAVTISIKDRADARLLVAEHANRAIIGWIHMQLAYLLESDPRAEIWGLVVAKAARGTGAGRALVEAAEYWAATTGMDVVSVRSNALRLEAHAFYQHLGYTIVKTQNTFRKTLR